MRRPLFAAMTAWALAAGPAAAAGADPWEGFNRRGFAIHQFLDKVLIRPAAMVYRALTPGPLGVGLHHVIVNLSEPLVFINDLFQLRIHRAAEATARFAVNSTLGVGGLIDIAGKDGVAHHESTFGDTLGRYGVRPGPYLFIPVIGPSTVRDFLGSGVDAVVDPVHWINYRYRTELSTAVTIVGGLDLRSRSDEELKALLSDAADPYATLRSAYLQSRQGEIDKGRQTLVLPDFDEGAAPAATPPPSTPDPAPVTPPASALSKRVPVGALFDLASLADPSLPVIPAASLRWPAG
ncbi:MAG: VacJ family lipoprotein [Caulobacteraceae bacterium]|nr:VacJ family lipoprotein [Caulobacteraceae bacterium]